MDRMPFTDDADSVFRRLEETVARANLTKAEQEQYDAEWKYYNDYFNTIDYATNQGRAEGRAERDIEIAKAMKAQGCATSLIATCTGLSEEEIKQIF